ncbi:SUN domain-containing protein [Coccidioides immitis RS]|uniref:SUN domain-containing protein n=4 Tax=Coccidioides TaxID=5500 RepID=A0A0E1RXM6_COCIM|nr:SUN domain-containing protein [Coccidioides immitis RS]XP_003067555.1 cell wall synthesis protein, putative [Coccidioides posadasii C735 delta SOWgp]EFW17621.1 SUN domain-containing protein [Coccidioides posadasii str. Silveira]KMM70737.1 cell wall synthesis protein [Coccidioides posadasii RMSCC 3488]EAS34230.1 SUN domain-containing protein [Coccidioides immitis RS]EER25410.1 cell wall synthesis protein, putative [Coccidioides posadasii C735 delta SOWgp]QVM05597.1 Secreted beta-glucosidase|eukprot:XP_003067555.1 cell wall synthesis protein, putative [Coccidioides posadasii C735 delta SOWgp]
MKLTPAILTLAAAGSVAASHHQHRHGHVHMKRNPVPTKVVTVPGPIVVAYELDGKPISKEEACKGITEGSLLWADGGSYPEVCEPTPPAPVDKPKGGQEFYESPKPEEPATTSEAALPPVPTPSAPKIDLPKPELPKPKLPEPDISLPGEGEGLDTDFPDGEIDCSDFPSKYGPISLHWLGHGGWSGVQLPNYGGGLISSIRTAIKGEGCTEGTMCSYACPPGYQKSQWPSTQGSTGESVGGLECKNGKLRLTNPTLSKKLCVKGAGGVKVKNTMSEVVSVCRTDYPGTESETIPLLASPGSTNPLTCPDAGTYYKWKNMPTSAQYYVNPKGIGIKEACQWGDGSKPIGNWAPINLGVGKKDGATWISIFQNKPTTNEKLDFKIEIKGDNLSGSCRYENGLFYSATGSNSDGCTVQVMSGEATYVFS